VILTGTPHGVAYNKPEPDYLRPGDLLRCVIEGLGEQRTRLRTQRVGTRCGPNRKFRTALTKRVLAPIWR
jgi:hypothetical protein